VRFKEDDIADLKRRLEAAQWPDELEGQDWQYGVDKSFLKVNDGIPRRKIFVGLNWTIIALNEVYKVVVAAMVFFVLACLHNGSSTPKS
jgi:hypothetical protein